LIDSFGAVIGGDIVPTSSRTRRRPRWPSANWGWRTSDAVVVGDTTHDIHMGNSAGCRSVGVTWGAHDAATLHGAAAAVATEMATLRAILLGDH
jgi:phosphoglycolate phosphatase